MIWVAEGMGESEVLEAPLAIQDLAVAGAAVEAGQAGRVQAQSVNL